MGNVLTKYSKADWVDGGRVREKVRLESGQVQLVDAWGAPITPPKDYDAKLVKKLIRQRRLAPFYVASDPEEMAESESSDLSMDDTAKRVKFKRNRKNRDDPEFLESEHFDCKFLQEELLDCPICLLAYPRNTNYTECCKQPLCTACFVKIKRPASGRVITCPFCNHVNFSICYHKPRWLAELAKESETDRDAAIRPDPVACEAVKLQVQPMNDRMRPPRSHTQPRYYYATNQARGGGNAMPRRYVFYEPSGAYTFYDNQYYRQAPAVSAAASAEAPIATTPSYYQHYQQQEYQRQQALRARAQEIERAQLDEAIRQSMVESGEAAEEYARVHR